MAVAVAVGVLGYLVANDRSLMTLFTTRTTFTTPWVHLQRPVAVPEGPRWPLTVYDHFGTGWNVVADRGGVKMTLSQTGSAWWVGPKMAPVPRLTVSGGVQFVSGGAGNALGLGCADQHANAYWFFVHDDGTWAFDLDPEAAGAEVTPYVRQFAPAMRPTTSSVNQLSVACIVESPTEARFMLAVNGTPVANLTYPTQVTGWEPVIAQCSPDGPDVGQFSRLAYSVP